MSHASNEDLQLALLYRRFLGMGNTPSEARAAAMGRDLSSTALFDEAISRVDADLLAISDVDKKRRDRISLGASDEAARADALDYGWAHIEEALRTDARGSVPGERSFEDELAEVRSGVTPSRYSRPRRPAKPAAAVTPATPREVEITEVGDGINPTRVESFRRMGLTESQAREAARGRS